MELARDLAPEVLAEALPGRPLRAFPALLSTESHALAWARSGAPQGAVVIAAYQASPRGRAGLPWEPRADSLAFSLVLRPQLGAGREGWIYTVATSGLADALGEGTTIEWPDELRSGGASVAAIGVHVELGPHGVAWAVVNVLIEEPPQPRAPLLARVTRAIEARCSSPTGAVLTDYVPRCETIGRRVRARLIPMGPGGPQVTGRAVRALGDGALQLETDRGRRIAVRPHHLGLLEDAERERESAQSSESRAPASR